MRRLLRWLVNGLCLLSLLACVGAAWLWWRSLTRAEYGSWNGRGPAGPTWELLSGNGFLEFIFADDGNGRSGRPEWSSERHPPAWFDGGWPQSVPGPGRWRFAFYWLHTIGPPAGNWGTGGRPLLVLWVPHWFLVTVAALPPLLWAGMRLRRASARRRRRRLNLCLRCGYDLTGNASGRCSECGEAVEAVRRVTA